jgi:hypothetical protein
MRAMAGFPPLMALKAFFLTQVMPYSADSDLTLQTARVLIFCVNIWQELTWHQFNQHDYVHLFHLKDK